MTAILRFKRLLFSKICLLTFFLGNLAPSVTESLLYNAFIPFGEIISVALHRKEKGKEVVHWCHVGKQLVLMP